MLIARHIEDIFKPDLKLYRKRYCCYVVVAVVVVVVVLTGMGMLTKSLTCLLIPHYLYET